MSAEAATGFGPGRQWWDSLTLEERNAMIAIADAVLGRQASAYEAYLVYLDLFCERK